ncbi:hypothetical protein F0919_13885 [Taibaiella lutea]|uniref:Uncharacterized protein n=1 Tax=Taibaiella lutea TaxID=2608001 RepID=A0A5M6CF94_9BACT|nr:DUF6263 family protein [Taibaiella lutea]KAA5533623.1 hypothetical protein F0919_13885 [Taibaiella lutea]
MKHLKLVILACLFLSGYTFMTSCKSGSNTDAIDLKLNFKAGDKYLYTTQIDQTIGIMQGLTMNQNMVMDMVYNCKSDNAGVKSIEATYNHILISMTSPMGEMKYDSKDPKQDVMGMNIMDSLIGKSFVMDIAPDGQIIKVSGLDAIVASFNMVNNPAAQQNIKNQLNDTAIRMMMQSSFDMYPGHKVKVGDTWNKKQQMTVSGINIGMENTYSLKSVENGKATLSVTSDLSLPKTEMGADSVKTQMELNGKQEGTIELDIATGQVISSKTISDIKGKMTMQNAPEDINIKSTISVSSKKQ